MKTKINGIWKPTLILIPFILGLIGFTMAGDSLLQAVYQCICLYGMGQKDVPPNVLVEIARWLAPLATAGSLILVVKALRRHVHGFIARCTGKSVAVFGSKPEKDAMLKALGIRGIDMDKRPVRANSYILLGEEEENLDFYQTHLRNLEKDVHIKCSNLPAQASNRANLYLFNSEEIAARLFWKEHCPYELSAENGHRMNIVLLGFDKLGRELLLNGLQNNIFDAHQCFKYHVIGPEDSFREIYHELDQISDSVVFYPGSWKKHISIICQADMIIVVRQHGQLGLLRDLTMVIPGKRIHVLSALPEGVSLLADQSKFICFDWKQEAMRPENILCDRLYSYAKRINLRYANLYNGVEETNEARDLLWKELDTFDRYSNISAADYHAVQLRMLGQDALTAEKLEWMAELEHIRWCRYHYLNNWTHGEPENGKNKDKAKRVHRSLIPYEQLSDSEKEKDRENIRTLLKLDSETEKDRS